MAAVLKSRPSAGWFAFYLGTLAGQDWRRAEAFYEKAVAAFQRQHEASGEIQAIYSLHYSLYQIGRLNEAEQYVRRAREVAEASGQSSLLGWSLLLQARHLIFLDQDFDRSYHLLSQAQAIAGPNAASQFRQECLIYRANVSVELGRFAEARDDFNRAADLAKASGDLGDMASARYGVARALVEELSEAPDERGWQIVKEAALASRQAAWAAKSRNVEAKAEWILAMLTSGKEMQDHLSRCVQVASSMREQGYCRNALARRLTTLDPAAAQRVIDDALQIARKAGDPLAMAYSLREQMRISWAEDSPDRAFLASQSVLEQIESIRDLQKDLDSQAGWFSTWAEDYYWLSGRLFEASRSSGRAEDLDRAFQVIERLRARSLLDALRAVSASTSLTRPAPPKFATLGDVQSALAADEALLSFQVAPWKDWTADFGGGSWIVVVTRHSAAAYPLIDRMKLRAKVKLFSGDFESRDGAEAETAVQLYRELLGRALADLPRGVSRLVIIPDDSLYQLPFAALRQSPREAPLGALYQISQVPSATLWLLWKNQQPVAARVPALVFADPALPTTGEADTESAYPVERRDSSLDPPFLPRLQRGREEGEEVVDTLRGGSILRVGKDASLAYLRQVELQRFAIIHFATHALVDERNPERSAIVLASPLSLNAGLLTASEIGTLRLNGVLAVLSSCQTASGAVLRGEGVMSLARAFFQARARTVVGSLWSVRDNEAQEFSERLYHYLEVGLSVSAALRAAQRDRIAAHMPAAAWAGVVVLGDGDLVPLPGGRKPRTLMPGAATVAAALAGIAAALLFGWRWLRAR
ncbi:MAG TPA: CHAT domain-containing protein [Burkholderiales bacterium]|nr:CHAT domain-containing protein [Burkholderiales bacterium]